VRSFVPLTVHNYVKPTGARGNGFDRGGRGPSNAIAFPDLYQVFGSEANVAVQKIRSSIPAWAAAQASSALSSQALEQIYNVQANLIINNKGGWMFRVCFSSADRHLSVLCFVHILSVC
jgi:hypothetical protein